MDIRIYRPIPCSNCVAPQLNSFHISVEFISHFAAALGQPAKSLHTFAIPLRGKIGFLSATESNLCSLCKCATNDWLQEKLEEYFLVKDSFWRYFWSHSDCYSILLYSMLFARVVTLSQTLIWSGPHPHRRMKWGQKGIYSLETMLGTGASRKAYVRWVIWSKCLHPFFFPLPHKMPLIFQANSFHLF